MKGVLSMKTNMQEINEPAFHAYLKKAQSSPNTIRSCLAAYRLYHSLYNDLAVNHLLCFKDYLIRHYKASTVNTGYTESTVIWTSLKRFTAAK